MLGDDDVLRIKPRQAILIHSLIRIISSKLHCSVIELWLILPADILEMFNRTLLILETSALCVCVCVRVCACVCGWMPEAMEGDGEVIISPVQNCSHCETGECQEIKDSIVCFCDDLILASDGVSCINATGLAYCIAHTEP